jgi:iron complex transport system permease protein
MKGRLSPVPGFVILAVLLVGCVLFSVSVGVVRVPAGDVVRVVAHHLHLVPAGDWPSTHDTIVWDVRMPRVIVGAAVGGGLAVAGCLMQGLFHNPMAAPGILGVSSGGALGAVLAFALGWAARSIWAVPAAAFIAALAATALVYGVSTRQGRTPVATLLLAGIAVNAFLGAAVSLLLTITLQQYEVGHQAVFWLMGGLDARTWDHVTVVVPLVLVGTGIALFLGGDLNTLLLGEETALSLGVSVQRFKIQVLVLASLITGASVAVSGVLAFVGLVVPHAMRMIVGPDNRVLIPSCLLSGAAFVVLADLIARTAVSPQEVRLGILTSLVGAPFFLYLLIVNRQKTEIL